MNSSVQDFSQRHDDSTSAYLYSDNVQVDSEKEIETYVSNLGKISIAIFLAFLMSAIASVAGAALARPFSFIKDKNSENKY